MTDCPQVDCDGEIDVPPGTFDGAELCCGFCDLACYVVIYPDGSFTLDPGEDE